MLWKRHQVTTSGTSTGATRNSDPASIASIASWMSRMVPQPTSTLPVLRPSYLARYSATRSRQPGVVSVNSTRLKPPSIAASIAGAALSAVGVRRTAHARSFLKRASTAANDSEDCMYLLSDIECARRTAVESRAVRENISVSARATSPKIPIFSAALGLREETKRAGPQNRKIGRSGTGGSESPPRSADADAAEAGEDYAQPHPPLLPLLLGIHADGRLVPVGAAIDAARVPVVGLDVGPDVWRAAGTAGLLLVHERRRLHPREGRLPHVGHLGGAGPPAGVDAHGEHRVHRHGMGAGRRLRRGAGAQGPPPRVRLPRRLVRRRLPHVQGVRAPGQDGPLPAVALDLAFCAQPAGRALDGVAHGAGARARPGRTAARPQRLRPPAPGAAVVY
eukprot:scaffold8989_cov93-Isochrysis_galbana.AAC.1